MIARRVHWKDYSVLSFSYPKVDNLLDVSKSIKSAPKLVLVLDVSGSMKPYMTDLINASLAAFDMAGCVKIIAFDASVHTAVCETKDQVRDCIVNRGGSTNIEAALSSVLEDTNQTIVLMTDGLANTGHLVSSKSLLAMARMNSTYSNNVFHCLGFWRPYTSLNADLLKGLSFDSSGIFHLGSNSDCLSCFIGDVFADYYFRRESVPELPPGLLNDVPKSGFVVRADTPLHLVFQGHIPFVGEVVEEATEEDIKNIFKIRCLNAMKSGNTEELIKEMREYKYLHALSVMLDEARHIPSSDNENSLTVKKSELLHFISNTSTDSQDVVNLRQTSVLLSQSQE